MDTLSEIKERLGKVTSWPWEVNYDEYSPSRDGLFWWISRKSGGALGYMPKPDVDDDNYVRFSKEDAELIAHAPEDIAYLLGEVARLTRERDEFRDIARRVSDRYWEV